MFGSWLADIFSHPHPMGLLIVAAKTAIVYVFLVVGLRVMGKRELGQMNIYDLVLIIVLANAVQNAMVGDDTTLLGGITAAVTLLVLNRLFGLLLASSPKLERRMVGDPVLILNDGHLLPDRLQREGITREQVQEALREHGLTEFKQARLCVLEVDGTISVVPRDAQVHRTRRHFRSLRLP
ncbi:MAG: DUF421 domain-containing protein [Herpetosiphon sp.]